jgi:hypothetical protein
MQAHLSPTGDKCKLERKLTVSGCFYIDAKKEATIQQRRA